MDTREDVLEFLRANDAPRPEVLIARVEPCLVLSSRRSVTGRTRLGGLPDLPEHRPWPSSSLGEPLIFIGQLDLADLAETRIADQLPTRGLLGWYFSDLDGGGPPELAITLVDEPQGVPHPARCSRSAACTPSRRGRSPRCTAR